MFKLFVGSTATAKQLEVEINTAVGAAEIKEWKVTLDGKQIVVAMIMKESAVVQVSALTKSLLMSSEPAAVLLDRYVPQDVRRGLRKHLRVKGGDHHHFTIRQIVMMERSAFIRSSSNVGPRGGHIVESCLAHLGLSFGMTEEYIKKITGEEVK